MKKIILFLLGIMLMHGADGQNSIIVNKPNIVSKTISTIIEEQIYPSTITCINSIADNVTFVLSNPNMQTKEVTIQGYKINDMKVIQDTVFFCGTKTNRSPEAIIGYFPVQDLFYGSGSICIHEGFEAGSDKLPVNNLTRMVVVKYPEYEWHVVCVGTCVFENKNYPCVVDFSVQHPEPWALCGYDAGYVQNENETITDIDVVHAGVQDYIATSGIYKYQGSYINIRAYELYNIFSTSGLQDMMHTFCFDTAYARQWKDDDVLLRHVKDDIFATASMRVPPFGYSYSIHVGFFNMNSIISGSVFGMVNNAEFTQLYDLLNWQKLDRFIKTSRSQTLALLYNNRYLYTNDRTSVFCEIDYSSIWDVTNVRSYYNSNNLMQGMAPYNSDFKYVMSGYGKTDGTLIKYEMETFGFTPYCAEPVERTILRPLNCSSVNRVKEFDHMTYRAMLKPVDGERAETSLVIICNDAENLQEGETEGE